MPIVLHGFTEGEGAVGGCTTIDSFPNDNGFLACARAGNPGAAGHGSTVEAVNNLFNCTTGGRQACNMVGHGNDGIIVTGTGQSAEDPNRYVSAFNQANWQPHFSRLRDRMANLVLWACHPGTGNAGADLLYALARVTGVNVAGPTGFLYCSNGQFSLEANSTWQVATPTQRPNPIQAPTPHLEVMAMQVRIRHQGQTLDLDLDSVLNATYTQLASAPSSAAASIAVAGEHAKSLAATIRWDQPFTPPGIPAAIATGRLKVTFRVGGSDVEKSFLVYNNRLLQDEGEKDQFYRATEAFREAVLLLLR